MITYGGLEKQLKGKGLTKTDLTSKIGISSRTIAKIAKGEELSKNTLKRIAEYLGCNVEELYREVSANKILQILRDEKEAEISGGLYHELQIKMTYNSNRIEGNKLSENQTIMIFETNTIYAEDGVAVDDILETINHFRAIDYIIDTAEDELSEEIIKHLHYILKHDTKDSALNWFAVGDYKRRTNLVGGMETVKPEAAESRMKSLQTEYNSREKVLLDDIISFHAEFERIHLFQDGNGRVGRLIPLKECLHYNIIPFITEDSKKYFYYRGIAEWKSERGWLTDTCLDGQDTFTKLLNALDIPYNQ